MLHKPFLLLLISCVYSVVVFSQDRMLDKTVTLKNTGRIINTLAADDMQGRKIFTPGIEKAAAFIAGEFKAAGLQPLNADDGFYQRFSLISIIKQNSKAQINGQPVDAAKVLIVSSRPEIKTDQDAGYEMVTIGEKDDLFKAVMANINATNNRLVLIDEKFAQVFPRLARLQRNIFSSDKSTIFILTNEVPKTFTVEAQNEIVKKPLANIVGILPGKSLKQQFVIFSGHYDHLGIDAQQEKDSIYNGANDDASGTTAVIQLANYYAKKHNNERTLVFAAFTGEEEGGFGSTYFSRQFDPAEVMAMFNIEMIGTESKWGTNSAYITGYEKTDMGKLLQNNLNGTGFQFYPDPYADQHLFYRSDNATLARLGVPAHTISTSKMDDEPNYHKVSDEVSTLNLENMNRIIKSIALSARTIVSGKDTPARVDTTQLD